jgi:hypothetical protein
MFTAFGTQGVDSNAAYSGGLSHRYVLRVGIGWLDPHTQKSSSGCATAEPIMQSLNFCKEVEQGIGADGGTQAQFYKHLAGSFVRISNRTKLSGVQ